MTQQQIQLLTYEEASRLLRMKPSSLRWLVFKRRIPFTRLSDRRVRFDFRDIEQWLHSKTITPTDREAGKRPSSRKQGGGR
jgi:excisionase family DNA binding protein